MKIHHLIHELMVLLSKHPEAKDFDLIMPDRVPPSPHVEGKEIRL